eukprot:Seg3049.1 transcript_id=Seg3049.1/GoldUCD/mRNA.D3Y31 product="hypothetical protein" protein_id=Seg3049.1/GoldUCD/D3Y31
MPTCTHIAYHQEAQRKARTIARKQEALLQALRRHEEEERLRAEEEARLEKERGEIEDARRREREEHFRQRGEGGKSSRSRGSTQKDLRHQQKILRDHGLVMGHVNDEFLS